MRGERVTGIHLAAILAGVLLVAGAAAAASNDQSYESNQEAETQPDCRGEDHDGDGEGDRQPGPLPIDLTLEDGHLVTFCQGESWDSQDPNTRESHRNSEAGGGSSEPLYSPGDGDVYVNPLFDGDCSGHDSTEAGHDDGCEGGTDRPALDEPVHARATGDAPGTQDSSRRASVYGNAESWGGLKVSLAVGFDDGDREGWAFVYTEDHSDQLWGAATDEDQFPVIEEGDGNLICIPFGFVLPQGGTCGEGDCTSHEYQSGEGTSGADDHQHSCTRDNTVLAGLQVGYSWLDRPASGQATGPTGAPPVLP